MADKTIPTEEDLARLFEAKETAQATYNAACRAGWAAAEKPSPLNERVALDIAKEKALRASVGADLAYSKAMEAFMDAQGEEAA